MKLTEEQIKQIPALIRATPRRTRAQIAHQLGCSVRTLYYWIGRWQKHGEKNLKGKPGRPPMQLK